MPRFVAENERIVKLFRLPQTRAVKKILKIPTFTQQNHPHESCAHFFTAAANNRLCPAQIKI